MVLRQAGPQGDAFKLRVFSINAVVLLGRPVICEVDLGEHISCESCCLTDFTHALQIWRDYTGTDEGCT